MRAFWRQWVAQMTGVEIDDWDDSPPPEATTTERRTDRKVDEAYMVCSAVE